MTCKWSRDAEDYLTPDGKPCRHDDYGDPTKHCTARRTCSNHVGRTELTCARCLGRARTDLRTVRDLAALMLPAAIGAGIESAAAVLAGPAADPRHWSERRIAMRSHLGYWHARGEITERQYLHARATMEDDDERHPYTVLTRWQMMLAEDYGHPLPARLTIADAAAYLDRNLGRVAQDDTQDFPLLARELRKCRTALEAAMSDSRTPERGAPCPDCTGEETGVGPRLVREYGHWCEDEDCEQFHYDDDSADVWVCPRNREHWWTQQGYADLLETRQTRAKRHAAIS